MTSSLQNALIQSKCVCVCAHLFVCVLETDEINSLSQWLAKQTIRICSVGQVAMLNHLGKVSGPGDKMINSSKGHPVGKTVSFVYLSGCLQALNRNLYVF